MKLECVSDFVSLGEKTYPCPLSVAMDLVGGKWKAVIIYHLKNGPKRFGELRRALISSTETVLSNQLKQLEQDGLVSRQVFGTKPPLKTVYSLTDFGRTFLPALNALTQWGNQAGTLRAGASTSLIPVLSATSCAPITDRDEPTA